MKPVKPSATRSQYMRGNDLGDDIDVVTSCYQHDDGRLVPVIITCWKLSLIERIKVLFAGRVYVEQLTDKLAAHRLSVSRTEVNLDKIEERDASAWTIAAEAD